MSCGLGSNEIAARRVAPVHVFCGAGNGVCLMMWLHTIVIDEPYFDMLSATANDDGTGSGEGSWYGQLMPHG